MLVLKKISLLCFTLVASVFLSACIVAAPVFAQISPTIHLPIVANGPSFESLNSYRITYTSIFNHPASSKPEHIIETYEWQRAANQYGFNSGMRFELDGWAMQEVYLIDEDGYGGLFGLVGPSARAEIDPENPPPGASTIPPLTVSGANDKKVFFGPNGGLPIALSEIISQSQFIGLEVVNGVPTLRYQSNDATQLASPAAFGPDATFSSAEGNFWVAADGEHIIKFATHLESDTGSTHRFEYSVDKINSLSDIELPTKYRTEIDALRDGTQLPYPDCADCLFPVFPNSSWGYSSMTVGNGLIFDSPLNGMTEAEMNAQYEQRLIELGWAVTKGEEWIASNETKDFSIRFEQQGDSLRTSISFLPKY